MRAHSSYELLEEIGRGENSAVFRGYDLNLQREVAIKQLTPASSRGQDFGDRQATCEPERLARFLNAAAFLAQLEHPNMVRVHSVERDQGWIVMELLLGTLEDQIADGPMTADMIRSVLRQMLSALGFLHGRGKVHGSVRPSNILINQNGTVKLSDFDEMSRDGELSVPSGSKKYLAPELIVPTFGHFGPQVDLYCLGFTVLELLTGPKFDALFPGTCDDAVDADIAWLRWHSSEEPMRPVLQIDPSIPADLAAAVDRLLIKNCEHRASSAAEILELLDETPDVPLPMLEDKLTEQDTAIGSLGGKTRTPRVRKTRREYKHSPPDRQRRPLITRWFVLWPLCTSVLAAGVLLGTRLQVQSSTSPDDPEEFVIDLRILPDADGVELSIDGKPIDPQQNGAVRLAAGSHFVSAKRPGFQPFESLLNVTADATFEVFLRKIPPPPPPIEPKPELVDIQITVTPKDAPIWVEGEKLEPVDGRLKLKHPRGETLQLSLVHPGYEPLSRSWSADELEATGFSINVILSKLEPPPTPTARVAVSVKPASAVVFFDGAFAPNKNGIYTLAPGTYKLTVTNHGYKPYSKKVILGPGDSELEVTLTKLPPKLANVRLIITPGNVAAQVKFNGRAYRPNADGVFLLPPEYYQVMVISNGFQTFRMSTRIGPGLVELPIKLQPIPKPRPALMRLVVLPDLKITSVWIDNKQAKPNKDGLYELQPGKHEISVSAKGYRASREVNLPSGESLITMKLEKSWPTFMRSGESKKKKN